ncbi:ATP-binding protein [Dyella sp. Tek66A03]|uniref:ATP-binding protein n=1 Tax=Dyella sp. Tek66A03 TaxID=3458298 RepID=UPI00403EDF3E
MNASAYIEEIKALRLSHARFDLAYRRAYSQAALSVPSQLIVVSGPTRVGKTTLGKRLAAELVKTKSDQHDDGIIPLIRVEAATTNQGKFSTKHFTLRMLEELLDPITTIGDTMSLRRNQSETHLRIQLERCLRYRKTRYILVDEAQHLLRTTSQLRTGEVIDTLKCLANVADLTVILIGGYELLNACVQSSHLNGRLTIVDFPPYGIDMESAKEFDRILLALQMRIPAKEGLLIEHREALYTGSLGCVGLLMGWTMKALAEMHAQSHRELRFEHFQATRFSIQNQAIADEIALGSALLGWSHPSCASISPATRALTARVRRSSRPFMRKPKRDIGPSASAS